MLVLTGAVLPVDHPGVGGGDCTTNGSPHRFPALRFLEETIWEGSYESFLSQPKDIFIFPPLSPCGFSSENGLDRD